MAVPAMNGLDDIRNKAQEILRNGNLRSLLISNSSGQLILSVGQTTSDDNSAVSMLTELVQTVWQVGHEWLKEEVAGVEISFASQDVTLFLEPPFCIALIRERDADRANAPLEKSDLEELINALQEELT